MTWSAKSITTRSISITRVFDAPRERVFAAWTNAADAGALVRPRRASAYRPAKRVSAPRRLFRLCMRSPDGKDYWVRDPYREVQRAERLVIVCVADDAHGVQRLEEVIDVTFAGRAARPGSP